MSLSKGNTYALKRNPFEEPPVPRAFYHPGSPKSLSKHQRKTAISPERRKYDKQTEPTKPDDDQVDQFLSGTNDLRLSKEHSLDNSSKFEESWPSSERPSLGEEIFNKSQFDHDRFLNLKKRLDYDENSFSHDGDRSVTGIHTDHSTSRESTLAKYVERFRKGEPKSREEREKGSRSQLKDFWWMSSSPPVKDTKNVTKTQKSRSPVSPYRVNSRSERLTAAKLASHLSSRLPGDDETRLLQEKADRLLEQSGSSEASSGMIVSTEGLGSSPSTASVSTDHSEERAYRPAFTRSARESDSLSMGVKRLPKGRPLHPEDDILYQWRLRRKMEVAKDSAHLVPRVSTINAQHSQSKLAEFREKLSRLAPVTFDENEQAELPPPVSQQNGQRIGHTEFTPAPLQQSAPSTKQQQVFTLSEDMRTIKERMPAPKISDFPISSPLLADSRKTKGENPSPHLHLMCDILPCPHQSEMFNQSNDSNELEMTDSTVQYKQYLEAERPDTEGSKRVSMYKEQKHSTKINEQKQSIHSLSEAKNVHQDPTQNRIVSQREQQQKTRKTQNKTSTSTTEKQPLKQPALKSTQPVDSAIGQAVKGFLFDVTESIDSSMDSVVIDSEKTESLKVQSDNRDLPLTCEVDDFSDGEEFAHDSLLQHLRKQRSLFEQQLRQIDDCLANLEMGSL